MEDCAEDFAAGHRALCQPEGGLGVCRKRSINSKPPVSRRTSSTGCWPPTARPKAATKEADAARFLAALRKDYRQSGEYDPAQYDFLTPGSLTALLISLLQKLNRDEAATQFFIGAARQVILETTVAGLLRASPFRQPSPARLATSLFAAIRRCI